MKRHSPIPQQRKIQKIHFPLQPTPPSNPKQTPAADNARKKQKPSKAPHVVDKESAKGRSKDEKIDICLREMFRFGEMGLNVLKRGMELVEESERLELDRRWKRLRVQEIRVFIQRAELVEEQLELIHKELQGSS